MLSILEPDSAAAFSQEAPGTAPESSEFEIVLGRAQVASWLFVMVIAIALCSSLAYLAGKATVPKATIIAAPAPVPVTPAPAVAPAAVPAAALPLPTASIVTQPVAELPAVLGATAKPGPPVFAEPETGKVYIQMGAVEKGIAMILAEGLRSHGFEAFVATGPSEKIFRVLIGPLPDPKAFLQAKQAVDAIDLSSFARKYEKTPDAK